MNAQAAFPVAPGEPYFAYDCEKDRWDWEGLWEPKKKAFCCLTTGNGCAPFDCRKDLEEHENVWSTSKRAYCCQHSSLGCTTTFVPTTTTYGYDCTVGQEAWESWSEGRRQFCCDTTGVACDLFNCNQDDEKDWKLEKK